MKKVFIIGPVRNMNDDVFSEINDLAEKLENNGHLVYWPVRHTNQNDPVGLQICLVNGRAILEAKIIYVWLDPTKSAITGGCIFDLGMVCSFLVYGLNKKIIFINQSGIVSPGNLFDLNLAIRETRDILSANEICFNFEPKNPKSIFTLGVYFGWTKILGLKKKLAVSNRKQLQPTPNKSFTNVILALLNE